jgi:hypothetical protein
MLHKAVALEPKFAPTHSVLGELREEQGKWMEAEKLYLKAIELDPTFKPAQDNLARVQPAAAVEGRWSAFLKGQFRPRTTKERLGLVQICTFRKHYRGAVKPYVDAFAADTKLADDLQAGHRYAAARSAALTAAGEGADAVNLDDKEKARLRGLALNWLQTDLALWHKWAHDGKQADHTEIRAKMHHWQQDTDFTSVRAKQALDKLPEAERQAWGKLWAEVAGLLETAGKK